MAASTALSQQDSAAWKQPFSLSAKALYEAASAVQAPADAAVAMLAVHNRYSLDEQGRLRHSGYFVYKVLNQSGATGWDYLAVGWEPWHQARPEIRVRVVTPDFVEHPLDPKTINEAPAQGGAYKTYSDSKVLRVPYPAIAPGSVVEAEYVEQESSPFFTSGRVVTNTLGYVRVPVEHTLYTIEAPAALPLRTSTLLLPDLKPQSIEADGRITLIYDIGRLEGFEERAPYLPPDFVRIPEIRFSTGASWQAIATQYAGIVDAHIDLASVKPIVETLIAGKSTPTEKQSAILDWLAREIRYTGIEFGDGAIVPRDPAETLSKKFGDCKDKSTLLVSMLRAAGIPAYVALLNVTSRLDVPTDLPGMGLFNHAIVYVPASPAAGKGAKPTPELWIDATDRYARLGQLPLGDQDRLALIARPESSALVRTPVPATKDNVLREERQIVLSEFGPATITERNLPGGFFESRWRAYYADKPDKEMRDALSGYLRNQYSAESMSKFDSSDPADLARPFEVSVTGDKAKRGYTDLVMAQAAIRYDAIFSQVPDELRRKEDLDKKKRDEQDKDHPLTPRTADWIMPDPYSAIWTYRIIPPAGFVAKALPKDENLQLGPARLTASFSTDKHGAVLAQLNFDLVKRRYSVAEATELRNRITDLMAGPAVLVDFEPAAEALLRQGKVREALSSYRSLIDLHPTEAVHHLQVARVLLEAGMGEAARTEARQAVQLEPNNALAYKILAQILKHDLVGRQMRPGSDLAGAIEAFHSAIKLDPDDHETQANLAILLEFDPSGRRYGPLAKLKEAVSEYEKLGQDQLNQLGIPANLAFARFYNGDFIGSLDSARILANQPNPMVVAAIAATQGSQAALAEANKRAKDESGYKQIAKTAGEMLENLRLYSLAADLLEAGASGSDAARTMGLATTLRKTQRNEEIKFANTPADTISQFILLQGRPDLTEAQFMTVLSRNLHKALIPLDEDAKKYQLGIGRRTNSSLARDGDFFDVFRDIMLQTLDPKVEGSDEIGYRVKIRMPNNSEPVFYVVKEDGVYKVLDSGNEHEAVGLEVLERVAAGNLKGAKALLDWLRADVHLQGGDDPLGGDLFPRFWTKGLSANPEKMKLAGASLLVETKSTAHTAIPLLEDGLQSASSDRDKTFLRLALYNAYGRLQNFAKDYEFASPLLKDAPESANAFFSSVWSLIGLQRYDEAMALVAERQKQFDLDPDVLNARIAIESDRGDYLAAHKDTQKLIDLGQGPNMGNALGWIALFTGRIDDNDIQQVIKAAEAHNNSSSILHTLACLYAETGKVKEAYTVMVRAMDQLSLDEPDDNYWYVLGRIAEQYGERQTALDDYRKLSKPEFKLSIPNSSYYLATMRLKAMGADQTATK